MEDGEIYSEYDSPSTRLDDLENKMDSLESELSNIRSSMITWDGLFWMFLGFVIFALCGDAIWEFIKEIFFLVVGFILQVFQK